MDREIIDSAISFYSDVPTGQYDDEAVEALKFFKSQQWQPIETAPKDGDQILAWLVTSCGSIEFVDTLYWCADEEPPRWLNTHADEVYSIPTHWMPLPNQPARS